MKKHRFIYVGEEFATVNGKEITAETYNDNAHFGSRVLLDYLPIEDGTKYRFLDSLDLLENKHYMIMIFELDEKPVKIVELDLKSFYELLAIALAHPNPKGYNEFLIERFGFIYNEIH